MRLDHDAPVCAASSDRENTAKRPGTLCLPDHFAGRMRATAGSAAPQPAGVAMTKHVKLRTPSDRDLRDNPMIGGSKGATMAGATPDDLEAAQGANTMEGDLENDTNAAGGLEKSFNRSGHPRRAR